MSLEFTLSTLIPRNLNEEFEVACSRRGKKKKTAVAEALAEWIKQGQGVVAPQENTVIHRDLAQDKLRPYHSEVARAAECAADAAKSLEGVIDALEKATESSQVVAKPIDVSTEEMQILRDARRGVQNVSGRAAELADRIQGDAGQSGKGQQSGGRKASGGKP